MAEPFRYNFEYADDEKIRVGYLGCGGHSYRNVFQTFPFAPVDLVAVCDLQGERAEAYARQFGARRFHTDHRRLLEEDVDALFIVTGYDANGHPCATPLAAEALAAGKHVWMEKPPAASVAEIEMLQAAAAASGKFVMVGFKKMFTPAMRKLREIVAGETFGGLTSVAVRYPQSLPTDQASDRAMLGFLDHIMHPGSQFLALGGKIAELFFYHHPGVGSTVASLRFESGAIGSLHLTAGQSGMSPLERIEVIGRGESAVVENGLKLTYYRKGNRGPYGRSDTYLTSDDTAPLVWEPEFSLGVLYNKGLFVLGYVEEVLEFCRCVKAGTPPVRAGLDDALEILKLHEAYRQPAGTVIRLG